MSYTIKIGTLCSGYDSQCIAMDKIVKLYMGRVQYELLFWAEIDKYCIQAHNALYQQWADRNIGDITKVDWDKIPMVDILFYSTPCTDISNIGMRKGMGKDSQTRSSLIWEIENAANVLKPTIMVMENVKAITNKRNIEQFKKFQKVLEDIGYTNHVVNMNAKDYQVPQNRERVFMVSIYHNIIDFTPPKPFKLLRTLDHILEKNVSPKYNLSPKMVKYLLRKKQKNIDSGRGFKWEPKNGNDIANCLITRSMHDVSDNTICIKQIGNLLDDKNPPTIKTNSCEHNNIAIVNNHFRRLTPREYFRLMDVPEDYIDKIQAAGLSDTQQYKMAGNSIVVACLYHLLQSIIIL